MSSHARWRAPNRATTPMSSLPTVVSRKGFGVALAASGLLMTLTAPTAQAAPAATQVAVETTTAQTTTTQTTAKSRTVYPNRSYRRSVAKSAVVTKAAVAHKTDAKKKSANSRSVAGKRKRVLELMRRHEGTPYRYGGTTPAGFDCSGFTQYVYRQVGIKLPRTSSMQRRAGRTIPRSQARPGDLVYMPGHIGIYIGNGMMYDSPRTGKRIGARKIWSNNYQIIRVING